MSASPAPTSLDQQKAQLKDLAEGLAASPESAALDAQMAAAKAADLAAKDPGPVETPLGLLSIEELITQGRPVIRDMQITPALKVDMATLTVSEKALAQKLIDPKDPRIAANDDDTMREAGRLAWLAIAISSINGQTFAADQKQDGTYDLTAKKKLYEYLWRFPATAISILWLKYQELDETDPFMSAGKKKP
jgi:hypothetical protein